MKVFCPEAAVAVFFRRHCCAVCRVGQNHIYAPYMTPHLVICLPKTPYKNHIYAPYMTAHLVICLPKTNNV